MEKLAAEKRAEVSKMSTERLRAKLIKAGYDEDEIFEMERGDLLNTYAEYLITPPLPESPEKTGAVGGMSEAEIEFRKQELDLRKQELEWQREWRQAETERQRREKEEELERQRQRGELEQQRRDEENKRRDKEMRFVSWSYKDRELKMRRRRNVRSPWRDKLVSMGRH